MSDGSRLRQYWYKALSDAESQFRQLVASPAQEWKRVASSSSNAADATSSKKGKSKASAIPEPSDVVIHRYIARSSGSEIYRLTLDVSTGDDAIPLEHWKAVLTTPELRQEWDPAVIDAHLVEQFDLTTRISKTNFTLGWPANPRDTVTISRAFNDANTVIDISTSLPRSADEPAFLRPSPPYVRSNVALFAWCIQQTPTPQQQQSSPPTNEPSGGRKSISISGGKLRITCFWQHDLRAMWNIGSSTGMVQQLSTMVIGLYKTVLKRGTRVPKLMGYGNGVSIERIRFQNDREALTVDYAIVPEDEYHDGEHHAPGIDELRATREHKRLTRSIECVLPSLDGWDVQISTRASSTEVESLPWTATVMRTPSPTPLQTENLLLRLSHSPLIDDHSSLKVKLTIEISSPSSGVWLNGVPQTIQAPEDARSPAAQAMPIFQDVASISTDLTTSSINTSTTGLTTASSTSTFVRSGPTERTAAAEKSILARVKRNYIYFSSLLQEPEAKWKRTTEARGVTITQLDSIDPTLVVYRAEAAFVGVGLWDLFSAIVSPGSRYYWDKQHEDATLLEHVNELTELWHFKTKPAWPIVGRDAVVLKTVYKSPTAIHVFAFSADDPNLFPSIPPVDPNVIRTQIDLQGFAIEALSPNTTLLTLLEQSDPKGWTNKTSIPTVMIGALAGIGEFVIKCGGPPIMTRLSGARATELRYDHERLCFRAEYETPGHQAKAEGDKVVDPVVECEIRCDLDSWSPSLDIVVDPPPQSISCLRRHRLSEEGGGLWLTIVHDAVFVDDERLLTIVRRAPGKEKGVVMVNGTKVNVDVEELSEREVKALARRKRVKPTRIPLDQPPAASVIRRRREEWDSNEPASPDSPTATSSWTISAPRVSTSPLARFFTFTVDQTVASTQQAVAVFTPATGNGEFSIPASSKTPMQYVLDALAWTQDIHSRDPSDIPWSPVNDKGISARRNLFSDISPVIPVHKGEKVIEGVSAEELAPLVTDYDCRRKWDDRIETARVLETYGAEARTTFVVSKAGFPFRDRGFHLASIMARARSSRRSTADVAAGKKNAVFCVSASFSPESISEFDKSRYNPYDLPVGRVFIDAWIFETLDPYTKENYAVPSTRCTRLVAVDYGGSMPTTVNAMMNLTLLRAILGLESYIKSIAPLPITRLPCPGFVLADRKEEDNEQPASFWRLRRRDDHRALIHTKFDADSRTYKSTFVVRYAPPSSSPARSPAQTTPRPSRIVVTAPDSPILSPNTDATLSPAPSTATISPSTPRIPRERTTSSSSSLRGRSSAFTLKGEVRPHSDLLVAELVVDSKLYPDGYSLTLKSQTRHRGSPIKIDSCFTANEKSNVLPLAYTINTMPSSPMHSSGVNATSPTRHLLRLTLPTAQYEISTVKDPLTGETQHPPPKPNWLLEMEDGEALVEVLVSPHAEKKAGGVLVATGDNKNEVSVVDEKTSLTSLGREELLDDRFSKMSVLIRTSVQSETTVDDIKLPIAISDSLLNPDIPLNTTTTDDAGGGGAPDSRENEENSSSTDSSHEEGSRAHTLELAQTVSHAPSSGRLLGFLQSPLTRFGSSSLSSNNVRKHSSDASQATTTSAVVSRGYVPVSTTIIIALIAFLIGSLLRSLLSPADFVYYMTDTEAEANSNSLTGWREIKRLFEIKYLYAGWDFQIAVVRRH